MCQSQFEGNSKLFVENVRLSFPACVKCFSWVKIQLLPRCVGRLVSGKWQCAN